jgi:hypothetical protein
MFVKFVNPLDIRGCSTFLNSNPHPIRADSWIPKPHPNPQFAERMWSGCGFSRMLPQPTYTLASTASSTTL